MMSISPVDYPTNRTSTANRTFDVPISYAIENITREVFCGVCDHRISHLAREVGAIVGFECRMRTKTDAVG